MDTCNFKCGGTKCNVFCGVAYIIIHKTFHWLDIVSIKVRGTQPVAIGPHAAFDKNVCGPSDTVNFSAFLTKQ